MPDKDTKLPAIADVLDGRDLGALLRFVTPGTLPYESVAQLGLIAFISGMQLLSQIVDGMPPDQKQAMFQIFIDDQKQRQADFAKMREGFETFSGGLKELFAGELFKKGVKPNG